MKTRALFLILSILFTLNLFAGNCVPSANPASWSNSSDWACGRIPTNGDVVTIPDGYVVNITSNVNQSSDNITFDLTGTLNFSGNGDRIRLGASSSMTIHTGGKISGSRANNTITIGSGASEWTGPTDLTGPIVMSDGYLPIELSFFKIKTDENKINLIWQTKSELNNDFFTIERRSSETEFVSIGTTKGAGTTTKTNDYAWEDKAPIIGFDYYRIKQTDIDGQYSYSKVEFVEVEKKINQQEFILYPNPTSDGHFKLKVSGFLEEVTILVKNSSGQEIAEKTIVDIEQNSVITSHDLGTHLAPGVYVIIASSDNKIVNKKLIVK